MFVGLTLRRSLASPLQQQSTIQHVHIGSRWYQVVFGWKNFVTIFLSGNPPTSTSILDEGIFLIYQQHAMSPDMYRPFKCDNTI